MQVPGAEAERVTSSFIFGISFDIIRGARQTSFSASLSGVEVARAVETEASLVNISGWSCI